MGRAGLETWGAIGVGGGLGDGGQRLTATHAPQGRLRTRSKAPQGVGFLGRNDGLPVPSAAPRAHCTAMPTARSVLYAPLPHVMLTDLSLPLCAPPPLPVLSVHTLFRSRRRVRASPQNPIISRTQAHARMHPSPSSAVKPTPVNLSTPSRTIGFERKVTSPMSAEPAVSPSNDATAVEMKPGGASGTRRGRNPRRRSSATSRMAWIPNKIMELDFEDKVRGILKNRIFTTLMTFLTLYALFGDDIRLLLFPPSADEVFWGLSALTFAAFVFEILIQSWVDPSYIQGFYFWLDVVSTATLVFDIGACFLVLRGGGAYCVKACVTFVRVVAAHSLGSRVKIGSVATRHTTRTHTLAHAPAHALCTTNIVCFRFLSFLSPLLPPLRRFHLRQQRVRVRDGERSGNHRAEHPRRGERDACDPSDSPRAFDPHRETL